MVDIYKYRFTTLSGTPNQYFAYLDSSQIPPIDYLVSPDNSAVIADSIVIVETIEQNIQKVDLVKEWVETNQHFRTETLDSLDVPANSVQYNDHVFKVNHSLMGGQVLFEDVVSPYDFIEAWIGEKFWADISSEGPIGSTVGVLTSGVTSGTTILPVSQDVINNVHPGHEISLIDATDVSIAQHEITVVSVNEEDSTITIHSSDSLQQNFNAASTYVRRDDKLIRHFTLLGSGPVPLGYSIEKGSHIPKDYVIRVKYTNTHDTARSAAIVLESLF